jgi:hypothetical protein
MGGKTVRTPWVIPSQLRNTIRAKHGWLLESRRMSNLGGRGQQRL